MGSYLVAGVLLAVETTFKLPVIGCLADKVLDTMFGPAEDFEYVSTTAPATPPHYS